jgi:hypothetical protein
MFANMTYEGIRGKVFYGGRRMNQATTRHGLCSGIFETGNLNTVRINGMVP